MLIMRSSVLALPLLFLALSTVEPVAAQTTRAKDTTDDTSHTSSAGVGSELMELRAAVARLEAALEGDHSADTGDAADVGMGMNMMRMGMKMMGRGMKDQGSMNMQSNTNSDAMSGGMKMGMGGMGMMSGKKGMMGGMGSKKGMGGMGMMMGGMGMKMMGSMESSADQRTHIVSALPGFPGASHIYHVGATGFFIDHGVHLSLNDEQMSLLNDIREKETLRQSTLSRRTEELEQELWVLTSADQPLADKVEAKIREITALDAEKRMSFIRSVGAAAKVLSQEQVSRLKGEQTSEQPSDQASDEHQH